MKKGFTLIELLAVIVVLAILALVVTPIVLNIVENAQRGSDERSLEAYAKVVQSTYYELKMQDPTLTLEEYLNTVDTPSGVSLTYNGSKVVCSERKVVETVSGTQTIELRNCTVDGRGPYDYINGSAGNKSVTVQSQFEKDSWSTVIANVKKGNTSAYKVGDTKEITLTSTDQEIAGTYKVRIVNTSTPKECSTDGFSQTACGFVIEFVDIITKRRMTGQTVTWPNSELRQYVNNDIYNSLPNEVTAGIIDTFVDPSSNKSTDKLYFLSPSEVWSSSPSVTRQLDYYKELRVKTMDSKTGTCDSSDSRRWLRSSFYVGSPAYIYNYYILCSNFNWNVGSSSPSGVAPVFRIESPEDNEIAKYTITKNLTGVTIDNNATSIEYGDSYSATIIPNDKYNIDTVKVTMGGKDITSSAYKNGKITISKVTGKLEITATAITSQFAQDSWSTVISNVKNGNTSAYKVGDIKKVTLTSSDTEIAGTYRVRIANMSTPSVCNTEGFSQTACGFVIEFVDIISEHHMNPSGEYKGTNYKYGWNKDGWPASEMYTYVNNDIYNALPNEIKNAIIDTYTVSGYGKDDAPNKTSTDKLYLLSTAEVWAGGDEYDTAIDVTRQLDYYKNKGVTTNNYSAAKKLYKEYMGSYSDWWLRTANSSSGSSSVNEFYTVGSSGYPYYHHSAYYAEGVSPAFRIG